MTPLARIEPFLEEVDLLLIMSVDPGFGGQPFIPGSERRIAEVRELRRERDAGFQIEVDGGIDKQRAPLAASAGAEILVAGSALYGPGDMASRVSALRQAAEKGGAED
jgi:ribulose-phosphate 3-epimerase